MSAGGAGDDLYDDIASVYHLVYEDWEASIGRQADQLQAVLTGALGPGPFRVLDVSCGIGTQAIGLARLGHAVTGSDASTGAVRRAKEECARRGLSVDLAVGDMRDCHRRHGGGFDVVLSADNSVPHLLTDDDLLDAFRAFFASTRPGGACVLTVRDYEAEDRAPMQLRPFGVRKTPGGRTVVFQSWEFDGDRYDVTMYFVREREGALPQAVVGRSRYYAVTTKRLLALLGAAGFVDAERLDDRFFQPVLLARRPRD